VVKILSFIFKLLRICLFFVQHDERAKKQGKFAAPEIFSANLSTETVDSFPLAPEPATLQPEARIETSAKQALP
jgi:hypothetical protein